MTHKRKIITFWCAMVSLLGLLLILTGVIRTFSDEVLEYWFYWSLPLIINLIHYAIFREGDTPKSD